MFDLITPVILTFNEEPNIRRCLDRLTWASEIVIVDSKSTDRTREIANGFPQVRWFERAFDTHADQWNYAIHDTGIATEWVLRLDCDYMLTDELIEEIKGLLPESAVGGFLGSFDYAIYGRRLIASFYPPKPILFRHAAARARDRGHTEVWEVDGELRSLRHKIVNDDRKAQDRWLAAQLRYQKLESDTLDNSRTLKSRLRRIPPVFPVAVFIYCLFVRGLILNGRAGILYSLQRFIAEAIMALYYLESRIARVDEVSEPRRMFKDGAN